MRYYGWYSNKMRGQRLERTDAEAGAAPGGDIIDVSAFKPRRIPSRKWRELIKKVWEADPLLCPRCPHGNPRFQPQTAGQRLRGPKAISYQQGNQREDTGIDGGGGFEGAILIFSYKRKRRQGRLPFIDLCEIHWPLRLLCDLL